MLRYPNRLQTLNRVTVGGRWSSLLIEAFVNLAEVSSFPLRNRFDGRSAFRPKRLCEIGESTDSRSNGHGRRRLSEIRDHHRSGGSLRFPRCAIRRLHHRSTHVRVRARHKKNDLLGIRQNRFRAAITGVADGCPVGAHGQRGSLFRQSTGDPTAKRNGGSGNSRCRDAGR